MLRIRPLIIAFVLCGVCASVGAQQAPAQQTPTFRGGVTLITVDVTVLDRDGKPVPGLTAADFDVKLDGKSQPVRAATFVQASVGGAEAAVDARGQQLQPAPPASAGRQSANNATPGAEPRVFVILVDDLSYAPVRGKAMFLAAQRFLAKLPASDLVGFTTTSGTGAVNPTTDRAPLLAGLKGVVGQFFDPRTLRATGPGPGGKDTAAVTPDAPLGIGEALDIDRGDMTVLKDAIGRECYNGSMDVFLGKSLEEVLAEVQCASDLFSESRRTAALTKQSTSRQIQAYLAVINAMKSATGIKQLVIMSDGLAVSRETNDLIPVARAAAAAGVQVSALLEEPDISLTDPGRRAVGPDTAPQHDAGQSQRRREDDKLMIAGVQTMAEMAGGTFYRVIGTPDPFFDRVTTAASAVYRLGIEPPGSSSPGRDFAVTVALRKPSGLTVHANRRAVAPGPPVVVPVEDQLRSAVGNGQPLYGVAISLATALRRGQDAGHMDLAVNVAIPASSKGPLTTMFGLVDAAGFAKNGRKVIDAPPAGGAYRISFALPVTPGKYTLRFAVADAGGSVGSIESTVMARLTAMGPFTASDLLTWWVDADGKAQFLALEDLPDNLPALSAAIELYPSAGAPSAADIHVKLGLYASGAATPVVERDVTPEPGEGMLRAEAQFPVDTLPPGQYALRATVTVGDKVVGTTGATIKKR